MRGSRVEVIPANSWCSLARYFNDGWWKQGRTGTPRALSPPLRLLPLRVFPGSPAVVVVMSTNSAASAAEAEFIRECRRLAASLATDGAGCAHCMHAFTEKVIQLEQRDPVIVAQMRQPVSTGANLWHTTNSLLTGPGSDLDSWRADVVDATSRCTRHHPVRHIHPEPLTALVGLQRTLLVHALGGKWQLSHAMLPKSVFRERPDEWPMDLPQLFPHGIGNTLRAHIQWSTSMVSYASSAALAHLILVCHAVVMPELLSSPPMREDMLWLVVHFLYAVEAPEGPTDIVWPEGASQCVLPDAPWYTTGNASTLLAVRVAACLLRSIFEGPDATLDSITRFIAGYEAILATALRAGIRAFQAVRDGWKTSPFRDLVLIAFAVDRIQTAKNPKRTREDKQFLVEASKAHPGLMQTLEADLVITRVQAALIGRTCVEPSCTSPHGKTEVLARMHQCMSCVEQYCSDACRRKDWARHRFLCPLLRLLIKNCDVSTVSSDTSFAKYLASDEEDRLTLTSWAMRVAAPPGREKGLFDV